jgi:hypothetical protein
MDTSLGAVLDRHTIEEFSYVCDWGSSTHLSLSIVETGSWVLSTIDSDSEEDVSTEQEGLLLLIRWFVFCFVTGPNISTSAALKTVF